MALRGEKRSGIFATLGEHPSHCDGVKLVLVLDHYGLSGYPHWTMTQLPNVLNQKSAPAGCTALWIAIGLVLLGAAFNLWSLYGGGAFDLSDDESHYFLWSRFLDYGYYSKGPGIAWVHWLSTQIAALFGASPSAATLRTAAVVCSVISGLMSIALARSIFRNNRAALMVTVLSAAVPMFAVGAVIITIDAPMYMFWTLSVYLLWRYIDGGKTGWLYASAVAAGLGILCKPIPVFVPIGAVIACFFDAGIRKRFKTWHVLGGLAVLAASQIPFVLWNIHHNWMTLRHMGGQAGVGGQNQSGGWTQALARMGEYAGSQAGAMGGLMFVFIITAVIVAFTTLRRNQTRGDQPLRWPGLIVSAAPGGLVFLLSFTLPIWLFYFLLAFRVKTQVNWPAASYFAAMVLLGGVAAHAWGLCRGRINDEIRMTNDEMGEGGKRERRNAKRETEAQKNTKENAEVDPLLAWRRKSWRVMLILTVAWGLTLNVFANNAQWFYPMVANKAFKADGTMTAWHPRRWDLTARLRGLQERALQVQIVREKMQADTGAPPLIAATRWDLASSLSFYLPDRPFVFSVMSAIGGRHSQYDLWPGLNEKDSTGRLKYAGRNLVLVCDTTDRKAIEGIKAKLAGSFERIEEPEILPIKVLGLRLREVAVCRCYGFKGLPISGDADY